MTIRTKLATGLWLMLAVPAASWAADSADKPARDERSAATTGEATRPGTQDKAITRGPQSPAQPGVIEDLRDGRRQCEGLSGQERAACDARAAATAESPRGREGANPTGSSKPATGSSGPATGSSGSSGR